MGLQSLFADCNLKLQLSLHTDSSSAKAVASRRGAGKSTRHMQTSRRKEWSDRTSCEDGETRNPRKSRSSRMSSLQLNGWKRVMQRSRTNRMMRLQRSRTSRRMQNCDGCILWIELSKMVESGDMDKLCGLGWNFATREKDQNHELTEWRLLRRCDVNCSAMPCAAATWQDIGLMSCRNWKRKRKKT